MALTITYDEYGVVANVVRAANSVLEKAVQ